MAPHDVADATAARRPQERSRETRDKILTAAAEVLVEHGYSGASTLRIQDAAGISRGRLLHHYPSRAQLLSAAVNHIAMERMATLTTVHDLRADLDERIVEAVDVMWANFHEPYFWASLELWMAARTDPEIRAELPQVEHRMGRFARAQTDSLFGAEFTEHPEYPAARDLMLTGMRGVAVTYSFEPRDPRSDWHLTVWRGLFQRLLPHASDKVGQS